MAGAAAAGKAGTAPTVPPPLGQRIALQSPWRPSHDIVEVLHRKAGARFTPPGSGPEAPLLDVLVHGLDIRRPLGPHRDIPESRLRTALAFLMTAPSRLVPTGALNGLRFEAQDIDVAHGGGPVVGGTAEALLLACTGRTVALDSLVGDGVPALRDRLLTSRRRPAGHH